MFCIIVKVQSKMRILIQRVKNASVEIDGKSKASIGVGMTIFAGIEVNDTTEDIDWIVGKILKLRIFNDESGDMNVSIQDINGEILVISQFTLHALVKKGNRPSYILAARPEVAIPLYEKFIAGLKSESGPNVFSGEFGADMKVSLINDGPVTILIDSKDRR